MTPVAGGGAALLALVDEMEPDLAKSALDVSVLRAAVGQVSEVTAALGARGASGDVEGMLGHSADFMEAMSVVVVGWVWTKLSNAVAGRDDDFSKGLRTAAQYWLVTEVPRVDALLKLCVSEDRSYLDLQPAWL